jgi:hypothetical protein
VAIPKIGDRIDIPTKDGFWTVTVRSIDNAGFLYFKETGRAINWHDHLDKIQQEIAFRKEELAVVQGVLLIGIALMFGI